MLLFSTGFQGEPGAQGPPGEPVSKNVMSFKSSVTEEKHEVTEKDGFVFHRGSDPMGSM